MPKPNTNKPASAPSSGSLKVPKKGKSGAGTKKLVIGAVSVVGVALLSQLISKKDVEAAVITLTEEKAVADFVGRHPEGALIDFYTPKCPHCQKLAPEYEAAALELKASGGAPFGSVDAEHLPSVAKKYGVDRYPTMLWFRKGENVLELGPKTRTKKLLVEYVAWASEPAFVEFETAAELEESLPTLRSTLKENQPPVIVGREDHNKSGFRTAFEAVAERLRGKTAFLLIQSDGAASLSAYGKDTANDQHFSGATFEVDAVIAWARALVEKKKPAGESD